MPITKYTGPVLAMLVYMPLVVLGQPKGVVIVDEGDDVPPQVAREIAAFEVRLEKVDIGGNSELEERFGQEVPVLFVNGRKAFKFRCTARQLRRRLSREVSLRWPFRKSPTR